MNYRRVSEFGWVLLLTSVMAWFVVYRARTEVTSPVAGSTAEYAVELGDLKEFSYSDFPFYYSLEVQSDGSGTYTSSYDCVGATAEPGRVGCQHLEGKVTRQKVEQLWTRLRAAHPEHFPPELFGKGPAGFSPGLYLSFGKQRVALTDARKTKQLFASLAELHPHEILQEMKAKRAAQEQALKSHKE